VKKVLNGSTHLQLSVQHDLLLKADLLNADLWSVYPSSEMTTVSREFRFDDGEAANAFVARIGHIMNTPKLAVQMTYEAAAQVLVEIAIDLKHQVLKLAMRVMEDCDHTAKATRLRFSKANA